MWNTRIPLVLLSLVVALTADAGVVSTAGTVVIETDPHADPANATIFVYDEKSGIPFVATQGLQFGAIAPGTWVDSHYVQFDPVTPSGIVGTGTITFDGPILGITTQTADLVANLAPEAVGTSDSYFGLEDTLGPYPAGAIPSARGLGSPEDDLVPNLGGTVLTIDSLEIPTGGAGNVDGFRVFTATAQVPLHISPVVVVILLAAAAVLPLRRRRAAVPIG